MSIAGGVIFYVLIWSLFVAIGAAVGFTAIGAVLGTVACLALLIWASM